MKIGDLVKYVTGDEWRAEGEQPDYGIITKLAGGQHPQHHYVVWYSCDIEGWWNPQLLEVVSESR